MREQRDTASGDQRVQAVKLRYPAETAGILTGLLLLCGFLLYTVPVFAQSSFEGAGEISAVISEDFKTGFEQKTYSLIVDQSTIYTLFFNDAPPEDISTGDFAYVVGEFVSGGAWGDGVLVHAIYSMPRTDALVGSTSTARNALVIVVNFNDRSAGCSNAAADNLMWNGTRSINGLFEESSFNTVSFPRDTNADSSADVVNVTLSENIGTTCDYYNWAIAADTQAINSGFDLNDYQHRIYILPENAPCAWAGLGNLGCGSYCRAWTLYCDTADVLAHELGHNLGLNRARTDTNNDGTYDCEYCDTSGVMGYGGIGFRHFNAPHKAYLGWIPSSGVQTATMDGGYVLAVNEVLPSAASPAPPTDYQVVRTLVPGSSNEYYYFSYRAQEGSYSVNLPLQYRNEISVHRVSAGSSYSMYVTSIGDGESWSDGNGLELSSVSASATYASFSLAGVSAGGGDSGDGGSDSCSVSGRVLKDGEAPRNFRKLKVVLKKTGVRGSSRSRVNSDGSYSIDDCVPGPSRIKVQRRKTRRRRSRAIVPYQGLVAGAGTTQNFTLNRRR